jgi:hypothetical protein
MKGIRIINSLILFPLIIACNFSIPKQNELEPVQETNHNGFAVLELFTSEGCSSCPPADAVLAKLSEEYKGKVFVLGFHVDYWNRLGWTDTFSDAAYSKRQQNYVAQFHLNSIYTPQLIINGKEELVGSDERKARTILEKELEDAITQSIQLNAKQNGNSFNVSYELGKTSNDVLNIALLQLQAKTTVRNGENGGHVLSHVNIVRGFKTIETNTSSAGNINLDIPKNLLAKDCKVIAYLQDKNDLAVKAVAEVVIQ